METAVRATGTEVWLLIGVVAAMWAVTMLLINKWTSHVNEKLDRLETNTKAQGEDIAALKQSNEDRNQVVDKMERSISSVHERINGMATAIGEMKGKIQSICAMKPTS